MERKTAIIKIRCTQTEKIRLQQRARKSGRPLSEFCRELFTKGKVLAVPHFTEKELEGIAYLKECQRYFGYISNFMKQRDARLYAETKDLTELIRTVVEYFYKPKP